MEKGQRNEQDGLSKKEKWRLTEKRGRARRMLGKCGRRKKGLRDAFWFELAELIPATTFK